MYDERALYIYDDDDDDDDDVVDGGGVNTLLDIHTFLLSCCIWRSCIRLPLGMAVFIDGLLPFYICRDQFHFSTLSSILSVFIEFHAKMKTKS